LRYDITEFLKGLFDNNNIDYSRNLQKQLVDNKLDSRFFKDLLYGLFLMINIRDSISGETGPESDKISCPSCLFDSTDGFQSKEFNGDANGAYNVARKGKIILDKIKQYKHDHGSVEELSWGDLYVDNKEWDKFTQKK